MKPQITNILNGRLYLASAYHVQSIVVKQLRPNAIWIEMWKMRTLIRNRLTL